MYRSDDLIRQVRLLATTKNIRQKSKRVRKFEYTFRYERRLHRQDSIFILRSSRTCTSPTAVADSLDIPLPKPSNGS